MEPYVGICLCSLNNPTQFCTSHVTSVSASASVLGSVNTITNAAKKQFKSKLNSFKYKLVYQAVVSSLSEYAGFIYKQNLNSVQFGRSKILTSSVTNDANSLHIMDFSFLLLFVSTSAYQRVKARFRQGRCTRLRTNVLTLLQRSFQELYEIVYVAPVIRDTN